MSDFLKRMMRRPVFAAMGDGAGAAGADGGDQAAAAAAAAAAAPALTAAQAKWFEDAAYTPEEKAWLAAKGLAEDDPLKAMPKLIKGHRSAEQRIGKGLDSIIDKPAKDQSFAEWSAANRAALGLPDKEDAYTAAPPEFWPKEAKWDATLEANARKVAFENGVSPDAHKAYVNLFAQKMKDMNDAAEGGITAARETMMADLRRDFGDKTDATITEAKQAAQYFAEKAGLDTAAIESIGMVLSEKTGDANTIRFMAAIRAAMGEDSVVALGQGSQQLTATPADARAELQKLQAPGGEYYEATKTRNLPEIERLKPKIAQLTKIAAGK